MTEFFDKLKEGIDKVSIKVKETIEINKIKGQISKIQEQKKRAFEELGSIVYEMLNSDNLDTEKLKEKTEAIKEFERQIKEKEQEIMEFQTKAQKEIEGLKSIHKCECGAVIPEGSKFCVKCGKKIEIIEEQTVKSEQKTETAPHCECGAVIPLGAKFCIKCGRSLIS